MFERAMRKLRDNPVFFRDRNFGRDTRHMASRVPNRD